MEFSNRISLDWLVSFATMFRAERMITGIAASILLSSTAALAACDFGKDWGQLYGYIDLTTDYRFNGVSSSNRQPALQGGVHWAMPEGFYAGVFLSQVRFRDFRGTSFEADMYGGRHFYFDDNDLNLELLYSAFPDAAGHPSYAAPGTIYPTYNFLEGSVELSHSYRSLTLGGKLLWSPRYGSHAGVLWAANVEAIYSPVDWLKLSADWGHQWVQLGVDRSHFDVGVSATWHQQWVIDLRYYGTDVAAAHCYSRNWCQAAIVAKLTYQFQLL